MSTMCMVKLFRFETNSNDQSFAIGKELAGIGAGWGQKYRHGKAGCRQLCGQIGQVYGQGVGRVWGRMWAGCGQRIGKNVGM